MKIVQNFKKMCKNLSVLNLPNEGNDLVHETDASNEHWSVVLKIKEGKKNSASIAVGVLIKRNATIP